MPYQPEFLSDRDKKQSYSFPLPIHAICEIWQELASWLQRRYHLPFDDGRQWTTDAYLYYKLTYEHLAQVSKKYLFMKKLLKDNYGDINNTVQWYSSVDQAWMLTIKSRATEILKSKSVRSTDDVIGTCVRQSQKVTKTNDSSFSSISVSEIDYFSNTL